MKKYADKSVCVFDYGLHVELAITLSKDFGKVFYYSGWKADYPKSTVRNLGTGFKEFEKIYEFTDEFIDSVDLFVFPCILDGTIQKDLEKSGKLVWGSRDAELMEIDRKDFIEYQKKIGLPVPNTEYVKGVQELREYLNKTTGIKYVKANSNTRGDIETFKVDDREICEQFDLRTLEYELGHSAKDKEFIVQDAIEDVIAEVGYDGFTVDGQFPPTALFGIEVKDMGYIGKVVPYEKLPECVKFTNQKLSAALKLDGMRGNISTEIKDVGDDKGFLIDPTMRFPYPPCNVLLCIWENISECMYEGAQGNLVDMKFKADFAIEVEMFSDTAKNSEYWLKYPNEISEHIKIPYSMFSDGKKITLPQEVKNNNVGSIVTWGNSIEECKKQAIQIADQIKGHGLKVDFSCLDLAIKELEKL